MNWPYPNPGLATEVLTIITLMHWTHSLNQTTAFWQEPVLGTQCRDSNVSGEMEMLVQATLCNSSSLTKSILSTWYLAMPKDMEYFSMCTQQTATFCWGTIPFIWLLSLCLSSPLWMGLKESISKQLDNLRLMKVCTLSLWSLCWLSPNWKHLSKSVSDVQILLGEKTITLSQESVKLRGTRYQYAELQINLFVVPYKFPK